MFSRYNYRAFCLIFISLTSPGLGRTFWLTAPTPEQQITTIIHELSSYSPVRRHLEEGFKGDGVHRPYMDLMKRSGVKRTLIELRGFWKNGQPAELRVGWRLYFSKYDGPEDAITDGEKLNDIRESGLDDSLEKIAAERVMKAHHICVDCNTLVQGGEAIYSQVELYDNPWLHEARTTLLLERERKPALYQAVAVGSVVLVQEVLKTQKLDREDLNFALWLAAGDNMRDVTDVIDLLLESGADLNAKAKDGTTPLMLAIRNPAHLKFLIARGANLNNRDSDGKTALDRAKSAQETDSVTILEKSGAN
jgi:ankyrin repeat protein